VVVQDKKTKDAPQSVIPATQSDWQSIVAEIKAILGKGSIVSNNHKSHDLLKLDAINTILPFKVIWYLLTLESCFK
jgi:hypothetical protein